MRLAFFVLLLFSVLTFAWQRGLLSGVPEGREPERSARQIAPERIRPMSHDDVQRLQQKIKEVPAVLATQNLAEAQGCVEFGDFSPDLAGRVTPQLSALNLGERLSSRSVELPGWFMVYAPGFKSRAEVDQRVEEMKKAGVKEMLVIGGDKSDKGEKGESSSPRFSISLGSFRDRDLAQKHRADLERRGIKEARVADTPSAVTGVRFQVRNVDNELAQRLTQLQKQFSSAQLRACPSDGP